MLSAFSVTYSRPPSMNARNRIPFFWDDAASVGSRILTFRVNLMSSQGVDRSLNNSRTLRPTAEETILSYTAAITSRLFHLTGLIVVICDSSAQHDVYERNTLPNFSVVRLWHLLHISFGVSRFSLIRSSIFFASDVDPVFLFRRHLADLEFVHSASYN